MNLSTGAENPSLPAADTRLFPERQAGSLNPPGENGKIELHLRNLLLKGKHAASNRLRKLY